LKNTYLIGAEFRLNNQLVEAVNHLVRKVLLGIKAEDTGNQRGKGRLRARIILWATGAIGQG
jgi:hypothetical protein